jgi:hypothetical protein
VILLLIALAVAVNLQLWDTHTFGNVNFVIKYIYGIKNINIAIAWKKK